MRDGGAERAQFPGGGGRNRHGIYYACENNDVQPGCLNRSAAYRKELRQGFERAAEKHDVGCFGGNVVGAAHGHTDMRRGQRGSVVQTITDHGHNMSVTGHVAYALELFFREKPGFDVVQSHLTRNGFRGAFAVACQHREVGDLQVLEIVDGPAGAFANLIAKEEGTRQEIVLGHQDRCGAVAIGFLEQRFETGDIVFREETGVARANGTSRNGCYRTPARYDVRFVGRRSGKAAMLRFLQNGARQDML